MSIFLKQIYRAVFRGSQYILIKSLEVFVTGDVVYAQTCGVLTLKNLIEPPKTQVFEHGPRNRIFSRKGRYCNSIVLAFSCGQVKT